MKVASIGIVFLLTYLEIAISSPVGFYHSKTVAFNAAPAVVVASAEPAAPVPPPPPPPAATKYANVDVVQVDSSQVVDQVNHSTGQIVGIVGNIANAIGNIVAQTVRDIGELARTARPLPITRKRISVPVQPVATKTVSLYAPVVTKTVQVA